MEKKRKTWLWLLLGILALAAVAAVVVCCFVLGGNHRPALYWNLDGHLYSVNTTQRQPDETGTWQIRLACEDKTEIYTVTDPELINRIDALQVMGLVTDKDGNITNVLPATDIATQVCINSFIKNVEGETVFANTSLAMNGMPSQVVLSEDTRVYDISSGEVVRVEPAQLQVMDGICAYADEEGIVTHLYVTSHPVDSAIYWRISRKYDSKTKQTSRTPDENGVYSVEFYSDGQVVTLQTKDQSLVTAIDTESSSSPHFGFSFDGEGYINGILKSALGIRGLLACENYDITELGDTVTATELLNNKGLTWTGQLHPDCKFYDISGVAEAEKRLGQPVSGLQLGDRVTVWTDTEGRAVEIYILNRLVDCPVFFSTSRKYDSKTKQTSRQPNAEGWYEVTLLKEGDTETSVYKTKDKELMSYLDSYASRCLGIVADENNVLLQVYHAESLFGDSAWSSGGVVANTAGSIVIRMTYGKPTSTANGVMMPDCKVYNASTVGNYGEETTLQAGDYIYAFKQPTGELVHIYVVRRCIGADTMYYNLDPQYDAKAKKTTRQPDEEGWYHYQLSYQGQTVTMKVGSEELASKLDSYTAVCLETTVDIIEDVHAPNYACGGSEVVKGYTYTGLNEKGKHTAIKGEQTTTFTMAEDCVIYDMTQGGKQVEDLPEGATIVVYTNRNGTAQIIYIY